jgi:hypothetical protein
MRQQLTPQEKEAEIARMVTEARAAVVTGRKYLQREMEIEEL